MAKNKNIDQLRKQGWEEMSSLLDTHMPTEKNHPIIWWYWLAGAAALAILVAVAWPMMTSTNNDPHTSIVSTEEAIKNKNIPQSDPISNPADHELNSASGAIPKESNDTESSHETANSTVDLSLSNASRSITGGVPESEISTSSKELEKESMTKSIASSAATLNEGTMPMTGTVDLVATSVPPLDGSSIQINQPDHSLESFWVQKQDLIDGTPVGRKFQLLVFSEMMWAISDRFGFLSAGPGVGYQIGKWTIGTSGGLTLPIPRQKTFDDINMTFSSQYNFRQELAHQFSDFNSSASGKVVYYENYTMKPGFKFNLFAQVHLSPRWSLGLDVGRIGYRWDFSQKAVPNQTIAARTDLTDLKSEIWYGGITAGFYLGDQWQIQGAMRMINPGDPQNIGVLPALRLEYRF